MKILKKILRIITILLPAFVCFLLPGKVSAKDYYFTDLPVYSPRYYYEDFSSLFASPYSWVGYDISPIFQRRYYSQLVDGECSPLSNQTPYISSSTSSSHTYYSINFNAFPDSDFSTNRCQNLTGEWYEYSSVHIGDFSGSSTNNPSVVFSDDDIDVSGDVSVVKGTGLNLNSMFDGDLFDSTHLVKGFEFPFYYDPNSMGAVVYPDYESAHHIEFELYSTADIYVPEGASIYIDAFTAVNSSQNVSQHYSCSITNDIVDEPRVISGVCPLGTIPQFNDYPVFFRLQFPTGSVYAENSVIYLQRLLYWSGGDHSFGGTFSLQNNGLNPGAAPVGDFDDLSMSFLHLFNFNVINPISPILNLFTDHNTCVDIPIIAGLIHSSQTRLCPIYPDIVYHVMTPVFQLAGIMLIVSYFYKWLRDDESVIVSVKGGKE